MNESNLSDVALAELLTLTVEVDKYGTTVYRNSNSQIHRIHGPAIIFKYGTEEWWLNGLRHREDGPAMTTFGDYGWFLHGVHIPGNERV